MEINNMSETYIAKAIYPTFDDGTAKSEVYAEHVKVVLLDDHNNELLRFAAALDALRKENEELRKLLAYITSFISIEDVGDDVACPGVVISSERFEEHATINGVLGFDKCEHPFNQPLIDVLKRAVRAKESEALEKARERLMKAVNGVMEAYGISKESEASHD